MLRRRQINAGPEGRGRRLQTLLADFGSRLGDLVRPLADVVRWPFERFLWLVEERVLWPLRERAAGRGLPDLWRQPSRGTGAAALAASAVAAIVLVAVLLLPGGEEAPDRVAEPARVAIAPPPPRPPADRPAKRELRGPAPDFGVAGGVSVGDEEGDGGDGASAGASSAPGSDASASTGGEAEAGGEEATAATSSLRKPVPAGPAAMKVARRFSKAFLSYEIGRDRAQAEDVFTATATPRLAEALSGRPPRLPENGKVPKARVVNLVPGPRAGKAYTVSVSLLRVGLTSELRLELQKQRGKWLVTDVRG
jgi:hypothetical protein